MSVEYSAILVVGVELKEIKLIIEHETTEEITKYDENTGKPYIKTISKKCLQVGDERFDYDYLFDVIDELGWLDSIDGSKLQVYTSGTYDDDLDDLIAGILIKEIHSYDNNLKRVIGDHTMLPCEDTAREELSKLGYNGPINKYLILSCSY